jgi:hypothetical protein
MERGFCPELVGIDGRVQGGVRVFGGFKREGQLGAMTPLSSDSTGYTIDTLHNVFPISFQVGSSDIYHGYVVRYTNGSTDYIVVEYFDGSEWHIQQITSGSSVADQPMDVAVVGRLVYIFREGFQPVLFYVDPDATDESVVVADTGPGKAPNTDHGSGIVGELTVTVVDTLPSGEEGVLLPPGSYAFTYQLRDSITGRLSALAEPVQITSSDFPVVGSAPDEAATSGYIKLEITNATNLANRFDQIRVYRSLEVTTAGGSFASSIYNLDKVDDFILDGGTYTHFFELEDYPLSIQPLYDNSAQFLEDIPFGRAAAHYQGMLVVSSQDQVGDDVTAIGEIRYSSPTTISPELFPPDNRFPMEDSSDVPLAFARVGGFLYGFSKNRIYLVIKSGIQVIAEGMHEGFGVVGQFAVGTAENSAYYLSKNGFLRVDRQGNVEPLNAIDRLVYEDWADSLEECYVTFDPSMNAIFILNPIEEKMVCFWFSTSSVSEIWDTNFAVASYGVVPSSGNELKRAQFFSNKGIVYRFDDKREKDRVDLLDHSGPAITTVDFTATATSSVRVVDEGYDTDDIVGCKIVFMNGDSEWQMREITGIVESATSAGPTTFTVDSPVTIDEGDTVVISPVRFRWVGWEIGLESEFGGADSYRGAGQDYFRRRTIKSLGCHFISVDGDASDNANVAVFKASVLSGLSEDPVVERVVRSYQDRETAVVAVADNPGRYHAPLGEFGVAGSLLFPVVEVMAADLDFVLISVTVNGNIERTYNPEGA